MKHPYSVGCGCDRCARERGRREAQSARRTPRRAREVVEVMVDWTTSRSNYRRQVAREFWDDFESGRPMGPDDY